MNLQPLFKFVHERHQIALRRAAGEPKPWTRDPILRAYRFTNVRREDDKVTQWIAKHWRNPHKHDPEVWFAMCVARYFNWPLTLEAIGYPIPWRPARIIKMLYARSQVSIKKTMARSHKESPYKIERVQTKISPQVFGGAYFLNSLGPKIESIVNDRLTPLWDNLKPITDGLMKANTLEETYEIFLSQYGFGSFMAAQIVADIKYTPSFSEGKMADWWLWAAPGPGSKRGLNRLLGRPVDASWRADEWLLELQRLQARINTMLEKVDMAPLHAQDVQGICCCEWDKYQRVKLGEGRPKQKFEGV